MCFTSANKLAALSLIIFDPLYFGFHLYSSLHWIEGGWVFMVTATK